MKLQHELMSTIHFAMGQGKNHYTQTSVDTIRANLKKYQDKDVQRRWTFKCLEYLTDQGFIRRKKRYKHNSAGHIRQRSSLISFTFKGVCWLLKIGYTGAREIYENMIDRFKGGDQRWPTKHDFHDGTWQPDKASDRQRLKRLTEIVFDSI